MNASAAPAAVTTSLSGAAHLGGLAAFGKIAFALLVIIALIFLCAWLARRIGPLRGTAGQRLKIISAKALGTRERVIIVEVEDSWLVLGVTPGGISKLHELPARKTPAAPADVGGDSFAKRFAAALKQNLRGGR